MASLNQNENEYFAAAVDITGTAPNAGIVTADAKLEDSPHVSGDAGVFVLGVRAQSTPTILTSTAGDYSPLSVDLEGKLQVAPYAQSLNFFQATTIKTDTSNAVIKAAQGGGIRSYLTDISLSNTSATAVLVDILDGAIVIRTVLVPAGQTVSQSYTIPLRGTGGSAMNIAAEAAVTSLIINAQGYLGN